MKGNLLQGTARGSLGDTVFYRTNGQQMARVRVREVSNPRTFPQLLQRVILNTVSKAYAALKTVSDHSFQNFTGPRKNQSEFMRRNVKMLQDQVAMAMESGDFRVVYNIDGSFSILNDEVGEFNGRTDVAPLANPYIISAGTLPAVKFLQPVTSDRVLGVQLMPYQDLPTARIPTFTWEQYATFLEVPVGSQLTIVNMYSAQGSTAADIVSVYRLILRDANDRTDTPMFTWNAGSSIATLNNPHPQNIGEPQLPVSSGEGGLNTGALEYGMLNYEPSVFGCAVINSQLAGTTWLRSNADLLFDSPEIIHSLGNAVNSFLKASNSALLLNQAN